MNRTSLPDVKRVVVRYKLKAERLEEHLGLLARVFDQLAEQKPAGLRYEVSRLADGVSFIHIATISVPENPLASLSAFKAFVAGVGDRCEEPLVSSAATIAGSYGGNEAA